ncbi:MAG: DNA methyltransferase, partial [Acidobacteriota bacterium]
MTSPPYWGLRDYGILPSAWGGDPNCNHAWEFEVENSETNGAGETRWQHTRKGCDAIQPPEMRVGWRRHDVSRSCFCRCGAWRGVLGLEPTPDLYVRHIAEIFREVWRVLRDDGIVWLNLGDCYATGAGKAANCPGSGKWGEGWTSYRGTRRSGKHEYVDMAMGPLIQPNRMQIPGLKPKDLAGVPWRVAFALQATGWYLRSDIIWGKPNPMPESVTDRPTKAHEYIFLFGKSQKYFFDQEAVREPDAGQDHPRNLERTSTPVAPGQSPHMGIRTA